MVPHSHMFFRLFLPINVYIGVVFFSLRAAKSHPLPPLRAAVAPAQWTMIGFPRLENEDSHGIPMEQHRGEIESTTVNYSHTHALKTSSHTGKHTQRKLLTQEKTSVWAASCRALQPMRLGCRVLGSGMVQHQNLHRVYHSKFFIIACSVSYKPTKVKYCQRLLLLWTTFQKSLCHRDESYWHRFLSYLFFGKAFLLFALHS